MPYKKFTQIKDGKKLWSVKNLRTGQIIRWKSRRDRARGIAMRERYREAARILRQKSPKPYGLYT